MPLSLHLKVFYNLYFSLSAPFAFLHITHGLCFRSVNSTHVKWSANLEVFSFYSSSLKVRYISIYRFILFNVNLYFSSLKCSLLISFVIYYFVCFCNVPITVNKHTHRSIFICIPIPDTHSAASCKSVFLSFPDGSFHPLKVCVVLSSLRSWFTCHVILRKCSGPAMGLTGSYLYTILSGYGINPQTTPWNWEKLTRTRT